MERRLVAISKFLSYVLRHHPESERLSIDEHGWAAVDDLLASPGAKTRGLSRAILDQVVSENDKQRFEFHRSGTKIRARQGHSLFVDLDLCELKPPRCLNHGTASHALASIRVSGLLRGRRQQVHLSPDTATAKKVGGRHGRPVVLGIRAEEMYEHGYRFFASGNGVWLTEGVPPEFIDFPDLEI